MEKTLPLIEHSIYQIYIESKEVITYTIPIYQRNYAWEEDEITALIKDVYDSQHSNKETYYIGTLVTYKRGDNVYEVIDGQQRLTTIYLILKALGVHKIRNKLTYSARKISASTIRDLDNYPNWGEEVDPGIKNGFKYASKAIKDIIGKSELKSFKDYFLYHVHIIHYEVPKDVDLNHYFEVMNSRGEQLEKHEIVKSTLCESLNSNKAEMATFSYVWEACSEMNVYIQQALPDTKIFGKDYSKFIINSFTGISLQKESDGKVKISDLLAMPASKIEEVNKSEQNDKFQPIIDFPNFLLIVLKLTLIQDGARNLADFRLDDKELLNEFNKVLNPLTPDCKVNFTRKFIFNLLRAKYLLDNYIVHHTLTEKEKIGDNPWKLQYYQEKSNKKYPKNLSEAQDIQDELVHLLSMFEVSFTPKQRKNYLFYCLLYLFNNKCEVNNYLIFLRNLADKYFYDVYLNRASLTDSNQPMPNAFDNALLKDSKLNITLQQSVGSTKDHFMNIFKQGSSDIPLFVFNYTDYIIWKRYAETLRGKNTKKSDQERIKFFTQLGCSDFELEPFKNFYFSRTRKSLEHYYPQAKVEDGKSPSKDDINCFGNFAMIGAEANSSGSNWDPKAKLDHYCDTKSDQVSVASLKFKIMMQKCHDNIFNSDLNRLPGLEWNTEDILTHQERMLTLLDHPSNIEGDN